MATRIVVSGAAEASWAPDKGIVIVQAGVNGEPNQDQVRQRSSRAQEAVKQLVAAFMAEHPRALTQHVTNVVRTSWTEYKVRQTKHADVVTMKLSFRKAELLSAFVARIRGVADASIRVSWELTPAKRQRLERSLWQQAVQDARRKADAYAAAVGLRITGVSTISDPGLLSSDDAISGYRNAELTGLRSFKAEPENDYIELTPEPIRQQVTVVAHFTAE
ncbi:MAG: SIMPL domain-containing protein [Propionibacteriaceae bacterium]|jgi:hypothetical protein|nr:SIMPL domain-containing protein [Propionibacteriaceae bacterium]